MDDVRRMKVDIAWSEDGPDGVFRGGIREVEVVAASDFDRVVAALEEAIIHHVEAMRDLRAERDAAIAAGQELANALEGNCPCYCDHPLRAGLPPCSRCSSLDGWAAVSGSSEPRNEGDLA